MSTKKTTKKTKTAKANNPANPAKVEKAEFKGAFASLCEKLGITPTSNLVNTAIQAMAQSGIAFSACFRICRFSRNPEVYNVALATLNDIAASAARCKVAKDNGKPVKVYDSPEKNTGKLVSGLGGFQVKTEFLEHKNGSVSYMEDINGKTPYRVHIPSSFFAKHFHAVAK